MVERNVEEYNNNKLEMNDERLYIIFRSDCEWISVTPSSIIPLLVYIHSYFSISISSTSSIHILMVVSCVEVLS